jgi:ubiquinone/menaquinone biosynthesis C-methylase UbiE
MSFDRLAPHYTWMERVLAGPRLQRCRIAWLESLVGCERILIVGVGHGHFLRRCAQRFPRARITAVDASVGMLQHARRGAEGAGLAMERLEFVHAALPAWQPAPGAFDAIVTHFFLDCFSPEELTQVVNVLARAARPEARWLLADFAVPERGWRRGRARVMHAMMYAFFRTVTKIHARCVTEPAPYLEQRGFTLVGRKSSEWGLLRTDCWRRSGCAAP